MTAVGSARGARRITFQEGHCWELHIIRSPWPRRNAHCASDQRGVINARLIHWIRIVRHYGWRYFNARNQGRLGGFDTSGDIPVVVIDGAGNKLL